MTTFDEVTYSIGLPDGRSLIADGAPTEPPPLVPPPVNLVRSSRNPTDPTGVRWQEGFSYLPLSDGELDILAPCDPHIAHVPVQRSVGRPTWTPYLLSATFQCSTLGSDMTQFRQRAQGLLDAATPKMVEYEFWHGSMTVIAGLGNLYLEQANGVDEYTATSVAQALGICEQYLGQMTYGGRGMIHIPPFLSPYLVYGEVRREGNLLLTNRDTIVVPGSGYGQYGMYTAPPPTPTSPFHVYATGITDVRLSPIYPVPDAGAEYQAYDRGTNTIRVGAQRVAVASWDGVAFARVDLTLANL